MEKALEHVPTLIAVVGLLAVMAFDRLKKRSSDADAYDAEKVAKAIEISSANTENIRDLTHVTKTHGEEIKANKERTEGFAANHGGRLGKLEELAIRLEPVVEDYRARTVTFSTPDEAKAARANRGKR